MYNRISGGKNWLNGEAFDFHASDPALIHTSATVFSKHIGPTEACDSTPPAKQSLMSTTALFRTTIQAWKKSVGA